MCELTLNGRVKHQVPAGASLLEALKGRGILVPSACGGRGACGLCKVRVEHGGPPELTAKERLQLSPAEQQGGWRLACQIPLQQDLAVMLPENYLAAQAYQAEVSAMRDLTHDIRELTLRLIEPATLRFKAGQYIQLQIPPQDSSRPPAWRAYSIASAPSRADRIELEIRGMPHGLGSNYIFHQLRRNDPVRFHGPHGDFHLRESSRDILLIAGGSGMAPIKAILEDMREKGNRRATRYFFGAQSRRDMFLVETMRRLEKDLPDFRFIPALSQPLPEDQWDGETGLITEVLDRHVPPGQPAEAYLCGSPGMIHACLAVLKRKGFSEEQIYYDQFTRTPPGGK